MSMRSKYATRLVALVAPLMLALTMSAGSASAATCDAVMSDVDFGSVSLRAGAVNQSSGSLKISCRGLVNVLTVCVTFGPGSGGAGGGNTPRYMTGSSSDRLSYQLSASATNLTGAPLNTVTVPVAILLNGAVLGIGSGDATVPIYARLLSTGSATPTGHYESQFSGAGNFSISYGTGSCTGALSQTAAGGDFNVSADVTASCELSVSPMDFGQLSSAINSNVDATASVDVSCSQNTPYSITMDMGTGSGVSDPGHRKMRNTIYSLDYGLYRDSARSQPWGQTPAQSASGTGSGSNQHFPVYGRLHAGQTGHLGTYSDSVIVTVNY
ncbi:spore coat U domain-containing protein [Thioclava sp.]|uniref:Csu type fimbrial protein n=1 Tax=Thioclava sp. TaxID=1933450 RepID=UPI003AA90C18